MNLVFGMAETIKL